MIRIKLKVEPKSFDERVRKPGLIVLAQNGSMLRPYWRRCLRALRKKYRGICAYLCVLIPPGTGAASVDHFAPKSKRRDLTYEWSNYRLTSSFMNAKKNHFEDVLDPFAIGPRWFVLDMVGLQVKPNPRLDMATRAQVEDTITRLDLNHPDCIAARELFYRPFEQKDLPFHLLKRWSPFVAREALRQGLAP